MELKQRIETKTYRTVIISAHHQSSQHGKGGGKIIPGNGQLGADAGEFQDQYEEGEKEAKAPSEHTPYPK